MKIISENKFIQTFSFKVSPPRKMSGRFIYEKRGSLGSNGVFKK